MGAAKDPEDAETRALLALADFTDRDVLEVGCGDGRLTRRYADHARTVLGLDASAPAIIVARAMLPPRLRSRVSFRVADVITASLPAVAFDLALLSWSL
jgi:ubiquinone/menaquinone biosynthesis C-methylase UbiE